MNKMTQPKTIKEKAIEEGTKHIKLKSSVPNPDVWITTEDGMQALQKAVDTYANEVDKFHSKLIDPKVISRWGKTEDERKAITDFILTHIRYFRRGLV
jgi:hypothetical protein